MCNAVRPAGKDAPRCSVPTFVGMRGQWSKMTTTCVVMNEYTSRTITRPPLHLFSLSVDDASTLCLLWHAKTLAIFSVFPFRYFPSALEYRALRFDRHAFWALYVRVTHINTAATRFCFGTKQSNDQTIKQSNNSSSVVEQQSRAPKLVQAYSSTDIRFFLQP